MLFIQGTRDQFAEPALLDSVIQLLGSEVTLHPVAGGDHSFKVPKKERAGDVSVMDEIADEAAGWMRSVLTGKPATRAQGAPGS